MKNYSDLPSGEKQASDGERMNDCRKCGGKTYMFYQDITIYEGKCLECGDSLSFTHKSMDLAIKSYNLLSKSREAKQ